MDILYITTIYNEIRFLPYKMEWCRRNNLNPYVIDNYSDDFSYEWLRDHKIRCHRIDTKGAFDLKALQREMVRTMNRLKPDWVVYLGVDLFIFCDLPIGDLCWNAQEMGCNVIGFPMIDICNTGEEPGNPFRTYFYYRHSRDLIEFVYKWSPQVRMDGDLVRMPQRRSLSPQGVMINYGRTKTPDERKKLLERRKLAWSRGLNKKYGRHYLREQKKNWTWTKEELKDIRNSEYWKYLKNYAPIQHFDTDI